MLLAKLLPEAQVFQTVNTIDNDESVTLQSSESITDDTSTSISAIEIPLISSRPILAVSPNNILVDEYAKRRQQLVLFDDHLEKYFMRSPITEIVIDSVWYEIEKKFFLLTATKIFAYDPNTMNIELIPELRTPEKKFFKCFTFFTKSSSLLIAYDEWESKFIDRWQRNEKNGRWKLIERLSLNLTYNECMGSILVDDSSNLAMTIYNISTGQWRMEVRDPETLTFLKAILLPGSNLTDDYRMIVIKNKTSDINWIVYSQTNSDIIAIDSKWKKIQIKSEFVTTYLNIQDCGELNQCLHQGLNNLIDFYLFYQLFSWEKLLKVK